MDVVVPLVLLALGGLFLWLLTREDPNDKYEEDDWR